MSSWKGRNDTKSIPVLRNATCSRIQPIAKGDPNFGASLLIS